MSKGLCYVEGTKYFKLPLEKLIYDKKERQDGSLLEKMRLNERVILAIKILRYFFEKTKT